jgi:glycosyltransferase involved in cell wall biosynthesis
MGDFKISAVCLTKNNSDTIKNSIESYKDIADEIIIVDTGSTDDTIQICKDLGCEIYEKDLEYDYSSVKNYGLTKTHYPYILFLDPDEFFEHNLTLDDKKYLEDVMKNSDIEGIKFLTHNIDTQQSVNLFDNYSLRFFVNNPKLSYNRRIYEVLKIEGREPRVGMCDNLTLVHTGYSKKRDFQEVIQSEGVLNTIEEKETIDYFYIARNYFDILNYSKCNKYCDLFFSQSDYKDAVKNSETAYLIYIYKFNCVQRLVNDEQEKRNTLKTLLDEMMEEISFIPSVYYEYGLYELDEDFNSAYDYLVKSISMNNEFNPMNGYINTYYMFEADVYYRLSVLDTIFGNESKAISRSTVSCMLNKDSVDYLSNLLKIVKDKDDNKIVELIYRIYNPKSADDYDVIINALSKTKLNNVFLHFLMEYNVRYKGSNKLVYIGMMLSGQVELAITTALSVYEKSGNTDNELMATFGIIYSNDKEYYNKYSDKLESSYQNILKYHFDGGVYLSEEEYSYYIDIYTKMYFVGKESLMNVDIEHLTINDLFKLLDSYERVEDYESAINLCNNIEASNISNSDVKATAKERLSSNLYSVYKESTTTYLDSAT